ncbi:hypothetical protein Salat_1877600 [Sesamum alatum]|uniref:Uncharacterized protein n=1 Tax=Sesamum alatum TaxID=300844 RepID=A0AAE1Y3B4_9LAMI|nr:hypothetical protein Salat_1877600 [Sesamum alatum]
MEDEDAGIPMSDEAWDADMEQFRVCLVGSLLTAKVYNFEGVPPHQRDDKFSEGGGLCRANPMVPQPRAYSVIPSRRTKDIFGVFINHSMETRGSSKIEKTRQQAHGGEGLLSSLTVSDHIWVSVLVQFVARPKVGGRIAQERSQDQR